MKCFMRCLSLLAAGAVLCACDAPRPAEIIESQAPANAGSFAPRLFNAHGRIGLSWLETDGDGHALRYASWEDGSWSDARTVARGNDWFANWADLPGVRPLGGGRWLAWWLQKSGTATYAYDIQLAVSNDGAQWRPIGTPHHDGTPTEHGFVSVLDANEGFGLAWLDGRNTAQSGDNHHGRGGTTLRYGSFGGSGEQTAETQLDGLVCDCCQTDAAAAGDGVVVVYRNRTAEEIRDINAIRFANGEWSDPVRVHADGWKIDGCPVNGPAVAARGDTVAVAWFTAAGDEATVRVAFSDDGGRHFAPPVRIDAGHPLGRVDIVLRPESSTAWASWMEAAGGGARLMVRAVTPEGAAGEAISVAGMSAARTAGFPRMTLLDDGRLLFAWTQADDAGPRVRTGVLRPEE